MAVMNIDAGLERLALSDVSPREAASIIQQALIGNISGLAETIVRSLRSWTWKALTARRMDRELGVWHDLIRRVASKLEDVDPKLAARAEILAELIYESIVASEVSTSEFVLQRSHTRKLLRLLVGAQGGKLEREVLGQKLNLQQANLTRVINMLVDAGLVTKLQDGKRIIVEISNNGRHELARADGIQFASQSLDEEIFRIIDTSSFDLPNGIGKRAVLGDLARAIVEIDTRVNNALREGHVTKRFFSTTAGLSYSSSNVAGPLVVSLMVNDKAPRSGYSLVPITQRDRISRPIRDVQVALD